MNDTFISIIIPVKNEEKYINKCLVAVELVDYPKHKYEIIVVDNNSCDNTTNIVKKFDNVILLEKMSGTIGAIRNFGVKHAKGEILAFLDGDCVPDDEWLRIGCNYLNKDKNVGCIGFAISAPSPNDSWVEKTWYKMGSSSKYREICDVKWLSSFNLILKKDIFFKVGGFDESLKTCEDADLGYKLNKISRLIFSNEITISHLANAKTLKEFFFKELWRGKGNVKSFLTNKNKIDNGPSVFIPIIYLVACFSIPTLLLLSFLDIKYHMTTYSILVLVTLFPFFLTLIKKKYCNFIEFIRMSTLYYVYLTARGMSALGLHMKEQ